MKKILVLGYFGYFNGQLDGQTIKTREVYKLINKKSLKSKVRFFDTQDIKYKKASVFSLIKLMFWCNYIIYLPGKNNLNKFLKIINLFIKFKKVNVIQIAIGGWLVEYLSENPKAVQVLMKFKAILVESEHLRNKLQKNINLNNVERFPNFRIHNFKPEPIETDKGLKVVFMARIMKEKGIDWVFDFADYIKKHHMNIEIYFYGPINEEDKNYFLRKQRKYDFVKYKGILEPAEIYKKISKLDVLVLPTRYHGEGFPGSIIDAYIAGIPVVVTNWKLLPEFVVEGKTGFIVNTKECFFERLVFLHKNSKKLLEMKVQANMKSMEYSSEIAWAILKKHLRC